MINPSPWSLSWRCAQAFSLQALEVLFTYKKPILFHGSLALAPSIALTDFEALERNCWYLLSVPEG